MSQYFWYLKYYDRLAVMNVILNKLWLHCWRDMLEVIFPSTVNSTRSLNATKSDYCAGSHDAKQINSDYAHHDK